MSTKFEAFKRYYELGVWDEAKLRNAVAKQAITPDEFKAITGKNYE